MIRDQMTIFSCDYIMSSQYHFSQRMNAISGNFVEPLDTNDKTRRINSFRKQADECKNFKYTEHHDGAATKFNRRNLCYQIKYEFVADIFHPRWFSGILRVTYSFLVAIL